MIICPQCGSQNRPTDKFCNSCGTPIGHLASAGGAPPPPVPQTAPPPPGMYGAPPPPSPGYGGPPPPPPMYGGPPPIDQVQIAPPPPGFGGPPFGPPQPPPQVAPPGYGNPPQPPPGFPSQGHGFPPPPAFGAPPPAPPAPQGYAQPQQGFGPPPQPVPYAQPPQYGYGAPQAYAPPQPSPGFGAPPAPQHFGGPPQPFGAPPPAPLSPYGAPAPQQQQPQYGYAPPSPAAMGSADTTPDQTPSDALRGFLVTFQSEAKGEFWPLRGGRIAVGRADSGEAMDIFLRDPTISSRHAVILVDAASGSILIEDTGSTNGTYVNDEHLGFNGKRELRDGDRLRLGGFTTIVKVLSKA